jgi:hypothetical protein
VECAEVNFRGDFLPLMKKKLISHPEARSGLKRADPCPLCGGECYSFEKDLGAIDYYDNTWTVCANPDCRWLGKHSEVYERGPY